MSTPSPSRWSTKRKESGKRRTHVPSPVVVRFTAEAMPDYQVFTSLPPAECTLAATDARGTIAPWCSKEFFKQMLEHWGRHRLIIRLAATPGAILHGKILREFALLRERAPSWRLVAESDGAGLASTAAVDRLLKSPYHEIVLRLGFLPPADRQRGYEALEHQRVFCAIQELIELRIARGQSEPLVVWIFQTGNPDERQHRQAVRIARQLRVDRFEKSSSLQSI